VNATPESLGVGVGFDSGIMSSNTSAVRKPSTLVLSLILLGMPRKATPAGKCRHAATDGESMVLRDW
jgi:hypothetical protein